MFCFVRHLSSFSQQNVTGICQRKYPSWYLHFDPPPPSPPAREGVSELPYDVQDTTVELTAEFGEFKDLRCM